MVSCEDYLIRQDPKNNRIVITLPQRYQSVTNTVTPISDRKEMISASAEAVILQLVKHFYESD